MKTPRIISRLFGLETKGLADPNTDLMALFGLLPSNTGLSVSGAAALQFAPVSSAIKVISEAVACLDVMVKEVAADGTETDAKGHNLLALLKGQANDWTSGYELIRDLVIDALSDDRGGLVYVNRVDARVVELIRYRSGVINVNVDQGTGEPDYRINNRPVASLNLIHLRAPFGRSPLSLAADAIGLGVAMQTFAANLFENGAMPSGGLKFPKGMGEASVKAAIRIWNETHSGRGKSSKTAVLYDDISWQPFSQNATDSQFIENRKFVILEIARAFRVPPSMLFDLDRATWGNVEQLGKEFLTYCLEPWLRALEGALTRALFSEGERGRFVIRFDRDDLTRADLQTRAQTINSLIASKVISPNEGRHWLNMPPREGGDAFENPNIATDPATPAPVKQVPANAA